MYHTFEDMKLLLFSVILTLFTLSAYSQDTLVLKSNSTKIVYVKKVSENSIDFSYPNEDLINTMPISRIKEIHFKSGRIQKFKTQIPKITLSFDGGSGIGNPKVKIYINDTIVHECKFKEGFHITREKPIGQHVIIVKFAGKKNKLTLNTVEGKDYYATYYYNTMWGKIERSGVQELVWKR